MIDHEEIDYLIDWAESSHIAGDGEWNQRTWGEVTDCGTACCIAGKWALDHGWTVTNYAPAPWRAPWRDPQGNESYSPAWEAASALGLDDGYLAPLFDSTNTVDDLRRIAKGLRTEDGL
jgi:hypothetical protein